MVLNTFVILCNHPTIHLHRSFHLKNWNSIPIKPKLPIRRSPQLQATNILLSVSIILTFKECVWTYKIWTWSLVWSLYKHSWSHIPPCSPFELYCGFVNVISIITAMSRCLCHKQTVWDIAMHKSSFGGFLSLWSLLDKNGINMGTGNFYKCFHFLKNFIPKGIKLMNLKTQTKIIFFVLSLSLCLNFRCTYMLFQQIH